MEKDPNKLFKELLCKESKDINFLKKPDLKTSKKFQSLIVKKNAVPIYCNLFKMKITKNSVYYQYSITFTPEIEVRNQRAKSFLIKKADDQIREKLGYYLHTGDTLFSPVLMDDDVLEAIVKDEKLQIDYSVLIRKTNEVINVNDTAAYNPASKILLELIIKEILRLNPNIEFYKNLFVKKNEKKVIAGSGFKVDFFPGYTTSVVKTELGLFLNVQIKNKILSTASCLELIDQKIDKKANKAQNIAVLKEYFVGRALRTVYSKRNYRVDDVAFDKTPANTTFNWNGKNISIYNYYEVSHKVKIKDKNQPMFVQNKIDDEGKLTTLYLVPELCLLAGIDDEMVKDRDFMKNLANETKFTPDGIIIYKSNSFFCSKIIKFLFVVIIKLIQKAFFLYISLFNFLFFYFFTNLN
jgi:aubergine-like protein